MSEPADGVADRPRVLVVEDEWIIADVLAMMLEDMGCQVLGPAPAIAPAVEFIRRAPPDAALLDVSLGGANSFPIAEELLSRGIPFLFLTGYVDSNLQPPFDRCPVLRKPVSEATLRKAVTGILAERSGGPAIA